MSQRLLTLTPDRNWNSMKIRNPTHKGGRIHPLLIGFQFTGEVAFEEAGSCIDDLNHTRFPLFQMQSPRQFIPTTKHVRALRVRCSLRGFIDKKEKISAPLRAFKFL